MGFLHRGAYPFLPVLARVVAALGAEVVAAWLQPSVQRPGAWRLFAAVVPVLLTTLCGARAHGGCVVVSALMGWDHRADRPGRSVSQPAARAPTLARQLTGRQLRTTLTGTILVHASRPRCARLERRSTTRIRLGVQT